MNVAEDEQEKNVQTEKKQEEEPTVQRESPEKKVDVEKVEDRQEGQELAKTVSKDRNTAVDAFDFGTEAGTADRPSTEVEAKPSIEAPGAPEIAQETTLSQGRPSQDRDSKKDRPEMNVSKPVSRQISRVNSPVGSRPVSSVGSGSAFVAPEEWESVPDPASGAASPVNRSLNQSPVSRVGTPGRSFAERAQSPIQRSATPGSITMPAAQYGEGNQKGNGRWERLGVLPSPNIEPLSWLDEKEKRRSLAAEQRMERVIESVVRNSTPVSVRSKGSAGSMGRIVGEEQEAGKSKGVDSDNEEPVAGGKSSRQSFAQRATGASSRQSIRTRDSRGSIASLLPIPLDEMAKKDLTLEDHELDRPKFDVSPIDLGDPAQRDEQFREATSKEKVGGEEEEHGAEQYSAPDAHAGAQRSPSPSPEFHHADASAEQPPRVASPLQDISAAAASPGPSRQASIGAQAPAENESRKYQVSPLNPEFDVTRQRQPRGDTDQGPRPFSYMEGQSTQEESLQQGYMGPRGSAPGSMSGTERGMRYSRRGPHSWQPPPPGLGGFGPSQQGPYPQRQFQSPPPSMVEYGAQQDPRSKRQSFQSPPPGLVEGRLGQPQGQENFNRQDFDPRSYSSEFTLPGVGPPDHSEGSELRQKRRSILGGIGSSKATPSGSNTPASKSSERVNERINPQHVDQQLHRTFSYQSSVNENELGLTKGGKKEQKKEGPDVLEEMAKFTDPANQKHKRQRSGIFSPFKKSDTSTQQQKEATAAEHGHFSTPPPEAATPPVGHRDSKKGRNKLQRNASSGRLPEEAIVPEKKEKKKRTSLLGSIFGRSGSEAKQREKEEKKIRKSESKGKLSKLRKANLSQPPVPEARSAAYAPVPEPPSSFQGPGEAVQNPPADEPQPEYFAAGDQKSPAPGPGYPPGLQNIPPPPGFAGGPGYPPPAGRAMYSGNGYPPPGFPPQQQPAMRNRYYQPQRAVSHDRALYPNGPPPPMMQGYPPQQRRFSEQMLQQFPPSRAYQTPPPPQQYRHPSASGSAHGSEYNALSPQVSAMTSTPPPGGPFPRHGSSGGEDLLVSPVTSGSYEYGGSGRGEYFGPRSSPGRARVPSDPFERQRMWYQQQSQQQQMMMQQRRMGRITEGQQQQQHHGAHPHQHVPYQQQQRPFELSLPTDDSENEDSFRDDRNLAPADAEKEQAAWAPAPGSSTGGSGGGGGYREVLPRPSGYAPPVITTSAAPNPPPSHSTNSPAGFALQHPSSPARPSPTRVEAKWKEVLPEEGEAELEKLREHKAREQLAAQEHERSVHPAYRHSPNPSLGGGSVVLTPSGHSPRLAPPGLEGHHHQRSSSGTLQMDPAYAKEYGIVTPPAGGGGGGGGGGKVTGAGGAGGESSDDDDDDDDEDLYAEPTVYRSKESGQQGAQVLERAQKEAGDTPSPPTVPASMVQESERSVSQEKEVVKSEERSGGGGGAAAGERRPDEDEEPVVMQAASYPGMEWTPRWDGTIE